MSKAETSIVNAVRIALSRGSVRLFRNSVGMLFDREGRAVTYGLCVGSSDLIGYKSVTITPDMVGQRVAVFTALEGKAKRGRVTNEQAAFIRHIQAAGGIAGVFRSVEEATRILDGQSDCENAAR